MTERVMEDCSAPKHREPPRPRAFGSGATDGHRPASSEVGRPSRVGNEDVPPLAGGGLAAWLDCMSVWDARKGRSG